MELIVIALIVGVVVSVMVLVLGRTLASLAEHNARLTYDALRLMRSKDYPTFTAADRVEAHTRMLGDSARPNGPPPAMTAAEKNRRDWEQGFEAPTSVSDD